MTPAVADERELELTTDATVCCPVYKLLLTEAATAAAITLLLLYVADDVPEDVANVRPGAAAEYACRLRDVKGKFENLLVIVSVAI